MGLILGKPYFTDIKDKSNNTMANAINGEVEEGENQAGNEVEEMEEGKHCVIRLNFK